MNRHNSKRTLLRHAIPSVLALVFFVSSAPVRAGEPDDKLHLRTGFGAWLLSADGTTGVRNIERDVDVSFSDIFDKTQLSLSPSVELSKSNWVLSFNGMYAKLEDSKTFRDGRGGDIDANMGIFDLALGYTLIRTEVGNGMPLTVTPAIGGRVTYLDIELDPRDFGSASDNRTWFDPYVGATVVLGLSD